MRDSFVNVTADEFVPPVSIPYCRETKLGSPHPKIPKGSSCNSQGNVGVGAGLLGSKCILGYLSNQSNVG